MEGTWSGPFINVAITGITIVRERYGMDNVYLKTELPAATYPYEGTADLHLTCGREQGEAYCAQHFPGIPVELVKYDENLPN